MNFKKDLSTKNQMLLENIGVKSEDREYSPEEILQCENIIASHVMSKSSKNGDLAKETIKFSNLMDILVKHEKIANK